MNHLGDSSLVPWIVPARINNLPRFRSAPSLISDEIHRYRKSKLLIHALLEVLLVNIAGDRQIPTLAHIEEGPDLQRIALELDTELLQTFFIGSELFQIKSREVLEKWLGRQHFGGLELSHFRAGWLFRFFLLYIRGPVSREN